MGLAQASQCANWEVRGLTTCSVVTEVSMQIRKYTNQARSDTLAGVSSVCIHKGTAEG